MNFLSFDPLGQMGPPGSAGPFPPTPVPTMQVACLRCTGGPAMTDPAAANVALASQPLMLQMMQVLGTMLLGLMINGGLNASQAAPVQGSVAADPALGGVTASGASATDNQTSQPPPSGGKIGNGSKVLVIGDSHTAGTYGDELDRLLRAKGAQVHTVGSSGASADNYISGKGTTVGYADHKVNGQTEKTASHATPKLEELIAQDKPDVIVVNLGANFRGAGAAGVKAQVSKLGEIAKKHNIRMVWVGPPRTRDDVANPSSLQKFDQDMQAAVKPYGDYISSAPFTPEYAGSDGVHYGGSRGTELAKKWAAGVAGAI